MQNNKKSFSRAKALLIALFALGSAATNAQTTYTYTGGVQTYTVPVGVTSIQLECWGAQGSGGNGGLGGYAKGNMTVTPGQVLNVYVGGQTGYNGGGAGHAVSNRNGGGASDIRVSPYALADRVIVAGAGGAGGQTDVGIRNGGAGGGGTVGVNYAGGGGGDGYGGNGGPGGLNGGAGNTSCHSGGAGGGGLNSGGAPSCNTCYTSTCGQAGTLGQGGAADVWENGICYNSYGGTNGGGGGYYGGGGSSVGNCGGGGGGGGSSWVGTLSNTTMTGGTRAGNGQIVITVLTTPGAALNFDGTDDYVNLGTAPALDLTGDMTVETWIYPNTGANGAFFFNGGGWGIPGYAFMLFGTTLRVELHNGSTGVQANNTVSINNAWHHVAFTRVASTGLVRVYLDGVLLSGTATLPGALGLNPGNATLGAYIGGSGAYFNGSMDETRVWNRALCDGEIQNNMNCQIPTNGTGLVANYHYNQGIAAGANGSVTTLNDATSNAVNGTLTNMGLSAATSNWIAPGGVVTGTTCGAFVPPAVTVTPVSQTNIACFGGASGAASVSTVGSGLTYNWTPGNPTGDGTASVSGLTAGTWTCTVTNSCGGTGTQTFNITQPPVLVVSPTSQTNISCFGGAGGAASVSVTGGTPTYSYNWTPGNPTGDGTASVTGLAAGTWTCTVTDANSCVTTQTFNVTAPSALVVTPASQTNISCNGGSNGAATINTPTGGAGGYTYNWTPGNPTGDGTVSVTGLSAGTWTCTVTDANSCVTTQTFNITAPSALVASAASQTNVSCSGGSNGSATVSVSGGNPGYFYNWIPAGGNTATATGLSAGVYTCQIFDMNTCVTSQTFSITQPAPLVVTPASQTNISCFGGSNGAASVSVTGGTSSYSYNWTPGNPTGDGTASVTGLTAGTWSCTVTDANSCVTTQTLIISQPIALSVTGTSTNVSCNAGANGSATVSPIGGTTPYTYAWSPSGGTNATATGLAAGTYTCVTTDVNGCTTSYSVAITEPIALTVTSTTTDVTCFGQNNGSASVSVSGGSSPYTYAWSPSGGTNATATGLGDGLFICTITDANGCIHTETVTINEPSLLSATSMQTNVSCNGGSNGDAMVMVTGGTGPYTYAWLPSGGTNSSASGLNAGTYTCTITDANGCTNTQTFNVTEPGVLTVTSSSAAISCNGGTTTVTVVGAGGTAPYTGEGSFTVTAGAYSYTVTDANGCTATTSITVTEPTALTATATATSILCDGGNATVTVVGAGGTAPYTGEGSFTELAGTYSYTVTDANGCTTTTSITITEPDPIGNSANITNVNCFFGTDGSIDLVSFGGTPGYTYDWNNGQFTTEDITGIAAGVYTVLITDANGCTHIDMVSVTEPSELIATLSTSTNPTGCGTTDGTIDISVAGGVASYTFLWNTSATTEDLSGIGAGAYTCTVTDAHGCTTTIGDNLSDPNAPTVTLALTADTLCSTDGAFTLTGESPAGGTFSGPGVTAGSFDPAAAGVGMHMISYTFTDISGCTGSTTDSIYVDVCTSSDIWNLRSEVSIYPNPNGGTFTLQTTSVADVMIYDAQGKLVYTQKVQANVATQMNIVESGMYMITVIGTNGERTSQRVMVTR